MFVKEITKRYDGKAVVDGVSFEIPKGKVLSLIGPNGAGKSTVMGMLSRLIARDSGIVDFEGTEITRWKSRELSKRLAILTQSNNVQMKLTVRELVAFGRFPYSGGRLTQEDNEIIDRAIAYMELGDYEEQFIDELSGGQRQRAYIAMVIAQDTEYILLDEPTNNLDIYHATNLMRIVRRLCDELGKTVILVPHEINYAAFYSDYICAFVDGKVAKFGTVQEVITKENLSDIYKVDFEIMQIEGKADADEGAAAVTDHHRNSQRHYRQGEHNGVGGVAVRAQIAGVCNKDLVHDVIQRTHQQRNNARDRILLHQLADAFRAKKLIGTFHGIHLTFPFWGKKKNNGQPSCNRFYA